MKPQFRGCAALAAAAGLATAQGPAFAHHPGGLSNNAAGGPIVTLSASTLEQGHSAAGISVSYTEFTELSNATLINATASGNEGVHGLSTIQSYGLNYAYGLTDNIMLGFHLPYVRRTGIRAAEDDGTGNIDVEDHGPADGIGDASFFAQYRFFNNPINNWEAAAIAGLKTPTGKTNARSRAGDLQDVEFQPGSGSWDPLFGLAVTHRFGPWSLDANVLYNFVTTGSRSTNLGDQFQYNLAVSYRLQGITNSVPMFHGAHAHEAGDDGHAQNRGHSHERPSGPALDLVLELNGEWHGKQEQLGIADANSGGNTLFVSPGLRWNQGNVSAYGSVGIPVPRDENGIQPEPEWRVTAGFSIGFE